MNNFLIQMFIVHFSEKSQMISHPVSLKIYRSICYIELCFVKWKRGLHSVSPPLIITLVHFLLPESEEFG